MPGSDLALLSDAARAAGDIARRFWRQSPEVWHKPDGAGPVTEADLAVDAMLKAELLANRPDYGWLSEETPDSSGRLEANRVFIIDPIDGTRAFVAGEKTFAHSLAVAEKGNVVAAVVYLPMYDALYAAQSGGTATCNGAAIGSSQRTHADGATLLTARPNLDPVHWQGGTPPPFRHEFRASLAYRLCLVAEGRFDAMLSLRPTWEWDIAAGDLIARQAGARVTDRLGQPLSYNAPTPLTRGIIAGPEALWSVLWSGLKPPEQA